MLTVFDYDTVIPLKVLETVWEVDELDAEEYMNGKVWLEIHTQYSTEEYVNGKVLLVWCDFCAIKSFCLW